MPCCMIRARDAIGISFGKHFSNCFPNRVTSARLRRKENGVHHLNCYHRRQIAPGKLRQGAAKSVAAFCRLLPLITTAHFSALLTVRGWCLPKIKGFKFQNAATNFVRLNVSTFAAMSGVEVVIRSRSGHVQSISVDGSRSGHGLRSTTVCTDVSNNFATRLAAGCPQ